MIPRNLEFREHDHAEIHTFVDASSVAYGAVVYVRNSKDDETENVKFVAAKSKVAPLPTISIPRLELMAAVLGLRLSATVCRALDCHIRDTVFWSDSMNVLWWIRNQSRKFKPFVANRLGEIHSSSDPEQWRYVPTAENPTDIASRGMTVEELSSSTNWWHGPEFLQEQSENWPKSRFQQCEQAKVESKGKMNNDNFFTVTGNEPVTEHRLNPERFSSWNRLVRINAWVYRFITNCQVAKNERVLSREIQIDEISAAENRIIRSAQIDSFEHEYTCQQKGREIPRTSKLVSLNPKIDDEGVMRSDSRDLST